MAVAVVILASAGTSAPATIAAPSSSGTTRYDGGPEEGVASNAIRPTR